MPLRFASCAKNHYSYMGPGDFFNADSLKREKYEIKGYGGKAE